MKKKNAVCVFREIQTVSTVPSGPASYTRSRDATKFLNHRKILSFPDNELLDENRRGQQILIAGRQNDRLTSLGAIALALDSPRKEIPEFCATRDIDLIRLRNVIDSVMKYWNRAVHRRSISFETARRVREELLGVASGNGGVFGALVCRNEGKETPRRIQDEKTVVQLIAAGEHEALEFKSSLRWDRQQKRVNKDLENAVVKTLAGFLNSKHGGDLLVGVADDGTVVGLKDDYESLRKKDQDGFELHLRQIIGRDLGASVSFFLTITFHGIDGDEICQVTVAPSSDPIYVKDPKGSGDVLYFRDGNATRPLPVNEAVKYVQNRWRKSETVESSESLFDMTIEQAIFHVFSTGSIYRSYELERIASMKAFQAIHHLACEGTVRICGCTHASSPPRQISALECQSLKPGEAVTPNGIVFSLLDIEQEHAGFMSLRVGSRDIYKIWPKTNG